LGIALRLSSHDSGLLGESVSIGAKIGRTMAHALLHRDYFPRILLSRQLDPRYCRDVVRRVAEEGRRGRSCRGRSYEGK